MRDLSTLSMTDLVATYNSLSGKAPIKKFETKADGIRRTLPLVEAEFAAAAERAQKKPRKISVSARCRELINAGKSDADVWAVVAVEFSLDDSKKHYPRWNRAAMMRAARVSH